jgi:hypothetical protein
VSPSSPGVVGVVVGAGWLRKEVDVSTAVSVSLLGWLEPLCHDVWEVLAKGAVKYDVGPHWVVWSERFPQVFSWFI